MEPSAPVVSVGQIDRWLTTEGPSVESVVHRLDEVRAVARAARIAEAHLFSYVREKLDVDDFSEVPDLPGLTGEKPDID